MQENSLYLLMLRLSAVHLRAGARLDSKEKQMLKAILYATMGCMLCSCASTGSYSLNGMTAPTMDITNMHYYMDDDRELAPVLSNPNYRFDEGSGVMCENVCRF